MEIFNFQEEDQGIYISLIGENVYDLECWCTGIYDSIDLRMNKEQLIKMAETILQKVTN